MTLPRPSRTIIVEPIEQPDPAPARPEREPVPDREPEPAPSEPAPEREPEEAPART